MKLEMTRSSETSFEFQRTIQRYITLNFKYFVTVIIIIIIIIIIIGGAVLSFLVSVQVPRYLLVPGTAATLAYCTNPDDR
jgi:Mn2+/Fe2+ NRAMP family transporter